MLRKFEGHISETILQIPLFTSGMCNKKAALVHTTPREAKAVNPGDWM